MYPKSDHFSASPAPSPAQAAIFSAWILHKHPPCPSSALDRHCSLSTRHPEGISERVCQTSGQGLLCSDVLAALQGTGSDPVSHVALHLLPCPPALPQPPASGHYPLVLSASGTLALFGVPTASASPVRDSALRLSTWRALHSDSVSSSFESFRLQSNTVSSEKPLLTTQSKQPDP